MRGTPSIPICTDALSTVASTALDAGQTLASVLVGSVATVVRGVAFWTAIFLPLVYLPLLFTGVSGILDSVVLGKLVAVNVVALLVGHFYDGSLGNSLDRFGRRD